VARRSPERSLTILGDLAQSTAVGGQERWDDALAQMDGGTAASGPVLTGPAVTGAVVTGPVVVGRVVELEIGYRVPAPILEFANRLLPTAAPSVRPSRSVRLQGDPPNVISVADAVDLAVVAVRQIVTFAANYSSVGVIAVSPILDEIATNLSGAGVSYADTRQSASLDAPVSLLTPLAAKGLEFDAVVVVEPARIFDEEHQGPRVLYVALTRAVQQLCVIHAAALPSVLAGPA
jgi:superfamily I DNA/RNA helicase